MQQATTVQHFEVCLMNPSAMSTDKQEASAQNLLHSQGLDCTSTKCQQTLLHRCIQLLATHNLRQTEVLRVESVSKTAQTCVGTLLDPATLSSYLYGCFVMPSLLRTVMAAQRIA